VILKVMRSNLEWFDRSLGPPEPAPAAAAK